MCLRPQRESILFPTLFSLVMKGTRLLVLNEVDMLQDLEILLP